MPLFVSKAGMLVIRFMMAKDSSFAEPKSDLNRFVTTTIPDDLLSLSERIDEILGNFFKGRACSHPCSEYSI